MTKPIISSYLSLLLVSSLFLSIRAFVTPGSQLQSTTRNGIDKPFQVAPNAFPHLCQERQSSMTLQMGYNLPPSGGGGDNKINDIVAPIVTVAALTLFFMSPLGGIFFAVTNSIFVLALLTPILIGVGFNVWNYFNTIEGTCPSCEAPVRVLKNSDAGPNICLNCGSLIRANQNLDGIELCNNPNDIFDEKSRVSSIFDIFTSDPSVYEEQNFTTSTTDSNDEKKRREQQKRERTIIDVDIEDD